MPLGRDVSVTWLGHATFQIQTPGGKSLIIDPWVQSNPACPDSHKQVDRCDLMLITHGHFDHMGDAVPIARATSPTVVGIFELATYLQGKGVDKISGMNKGGTQAIGDIKVTMVHAIHSCGILDDGAIVYGGEAAGYVVTLENGFTLYHAGDTDVFGDMRIIGELYKPDVALLPIGDFYTMSPRQAAYAIELLGVKKVIPMHYATFPVLTGTPQALRELTGSISGLEIIELKPGETAK